MKRFLLALTLIVAVALVMAGCGNTSEFSMGMEMNPDGKDAVITVQDPDVGDCVAAGSMIVGENDIVYIEPALEGDVVIRIQMFPESEADIDDDPDLLTEEFQNEHPDTPWRKMKGMRNFLVYDYQVESDIVWAVITNDLPLLHRQLQTYLK